MLPTSRRKGLSVNEALDMIFAPDSDDEIDFRSIVIDPPKEDPKADTDQDTDKSDDEVVGNLDHLPRRVLSSSCEIIKRSRRETLSADASTSKAEQSNSPESFSQPPRKRTCFKKEKKPLINKSQPSKRKDNLNWTKIEEAVGTKIPPYLSSPKNLNQSLKSPLQSFQQFITPELVDYILEQTLIYATQKNYRTEMLTKENVLVFIGVLLLSGYSKVPDRRLYWALCPDVHNNLISKSIRRDTFDSIMRSIHFADNIYMNDDRFYKVRPLFEHLNKACKNLDIPEYLSVDETIVPYYGHHGLKQFIKSKPIRFGYKLWVLSSSDGLLLHAEPYCGASTNLAETGLGKGADVVLGLLEKCKIPPGCHVVMDNLFTGIPLLKELSKKGIAGTGTLRENRHQQAPLNSKITMKKMPRGSFDHICLEDIAIVKWNDNTVLSVASNKVPTLPTVSASRWSASEKKQITVTMPQQLKIYNKHMGGVDVLDQAVANYRIRIRSKKWWWPLFSWVIGASTVNAWKLYKSLGNDISLLYFTRQCSQELLGTYGTQPSGPGKPLTLTHKAGTQQRFDKNSHWIVKGDQKACRCKTCGGRTAYKCEKCNVPLHPECHKGYHVDNE